MAPRTNGRLIVAGLLFLLSACGSSGGSGFPFDPELTVPTNLTAIAGNTQATLRWTATPEAVSYVIFYYRDPDLMNEKSATDVTSTVGGLQNGVTYYFRVAAVDADERRSGKSDLVQVTPDLFGGTTEVEENDNAN